MNFSHTIERLQLLHSLISQKRTGSPEELAQRLGVSRSCLYNMIEKLKSFQLPVIYSRKMGSFYYKQDVEFELNMKINIIEEEESMKINGGNLTYFLPSRFLDRRKLSLHSYFASTKSQLTGL